MALLTHLLACAFGMGSWVAINGLWVELPLLVRVLPEQWDLPSYITIIIQMANVGPFFVTLMYRFRPGLLKEVVVIYVVVSVGVMACLLLAFLWNYTSTIAGRTYSTAFLILTFFLALVDCTSSVTFLPFMMQLQPQYLTTFFIGEGFSGLIPALIALGQGAGISICTNITRKVNITIGNETMESTISQLVTDYLPANFSTLVFFLLMTMMMLTCLLSFFFLARQPKVWELSQQHLFPSNIILSSFDQISDEGAGLHQSRGCPCPKNAKGPGDIPPEKVSYSLAKLTFIYLLIAWVPGSVGHPHNGRDRLWCIQHGHCGDEPLPAPPAVPVGRCHHCPVLGALHRDTLLREGDGRGDPAEPQPQRAGVVRGGGAAGLPPGGPGHVPPRQRLRLLHIRRLLQPAVPSMSRMGTLGQPLLLPHTPQTGGCRGARQQRWERGGCGHVSLLSCARSPGSSSPVALSPAQAQGVPIAFK
ncbi:solute carrier family 52, riboflavin transporter, member 3 isoform X1 [Caloenas nicobarica]|uniref:solute carrier family 52, riboflavin transporter, member 3 isoform X1 n=1 Tax=Caloenas nicobarica TaxID=187106 RepID=UPI0032B822E4